MNRSKPDLDYDDSIMLSWQRCERDYGLIRSTAKPVLRMQSSEVAPRLEELLDLTGGRLGIFTELSKLSTDAGHSLVVADREGVVVRFESQSFTREAFETNGIALGSCWDERIAGTNGVSMAMTLSDAVTVSGAQHFHTSLTDFACTAVPIVDADNQMIGAVSLSAFDRGVPSDHLIARKLLSAAVSRVQSKLFETKYADKLIVSVSPQSDNNLFHSRGLVALDEQGEILGATAPAHDLAGKVVVGDLIGLQFEQVFGADARELHSVPNRLLNVSLEKGTSLKLAFHNRENHDRVFSGWRPVAPPPSQFKPNKKKTLSLTELSAGSEVMAKCCDRLLAHIHRSYPFVIEGESGTGKSALIAALREELTGSASEVITMDCAGLSDTEEHRVYAQNLFAQARVVQALGPNERESSILVFDSIDEMPKFAQVGLRSLLEEVEISSASVDGQQLNTGLRIVALCGNSLSAAVEAGRFREDLYYLLAGAIVTLPPVRSREDLRALAVSVASKIAGIEIDITDEAIDLLSAHDWPGNVRELRNVLQQALTEAGGTRLTRLDLQFLHDMITGWHHGGERSDLRNIAPPQLYDEKTMLVDALNKSNWNVSKAARLLGIGRATINRKIKHHGLSRPR